MRSSRVANKIFASFVAICVTISLISFVSPVKAEASSAVTLSGTAHIQDAGDTAGSFDGTVLTLGTRGLSRRLESIKIDFTNNTGYDGSLEYQVHVQNIGWMEYVDAGSVAGTSGQSLRLEGIRIRLTGDIANYYSVQYTTHIQDYGDNQGWVRDGALAGTTGESKRLEELRVKIVPLDSSASSSVTYRVHRQDYGWESTWATNGASSGTTGQSKRLEGIEIRLAGYQYSGGITYRTHIQNVGWESSWSSDGAMSGTSGQSLRLEAIQIKLTGDIANYYDVYYRVHAQDYGWLGWAKNGEESGTSGLSKRLEAIQIVLVTKGSSAPTTVAGITSVTSVASVTSTTAASVVTVTSSYGAISASGSSYYPYYYMLSTNIQRAAYDEILEAASNGEVTVYFDTHITTDAIYDVVYAFMNDHPEFVWLDPSLGDTEVYYNKSTGLVTRLVLDYYDSGASTAAGRKQMTTEFVNAADVIVNNAMLLSSPLSREVYIHNALGSCVSYEDNYYDQSAYSALVEGESVCAGYSKAFQYLLQRCGIPCYYAYGIGYSGSSGGNHAWNIVSVNSNYYNVDATWDDTLSESRGYQVYRYLNLPDSTFGSDHVRDSDCAGLPSCTDSSIASKYF
ncbi:MAG: hypothetical protein K5745_02285 [Saccharofermentans sp.]|nr:hypothetical protein [Saccharofermentans sp.]